MKNIRIFILKFSFFGGKIFSLYLNRRVFVMVIKNVICYSIAQRFEGRSIDFLRRAMLLLTYVKGLMCLKCYDHHCLLCTMLL